MATRSGGVERSFCRFHFQDFQLLLKERSFDIRIHDTLDGSLTPLFVRELDLLRDIMNTDIGRHIPHSPCGKGP